LHNPAAIASTTKAVGPFPVMTRPRQSTNFVGWSDAKRRQDGSGRRIMPEQSAGSGAPIPSRGLYGKRSAPPGGYGRRLALSAGVAPRSGASRGSAQECYQRTAWGQRAGASAEVQGKRVREAIGLPPGAGWLPQGLPPMPV